MIVKVYLLGPGWWVDLHTAVQPTSGAFVRLLPPSEEVVTVPGVLEEEAGLRSLWKSPTQREEGRPRGINQTERRSQSDWGFFVVIKITGLLSFALEGGTFTLAWANVSLVPLKPQRLLCRAVGWRIWTVWSQLVTFKPVCLFVLIIAQFMNHCLYLL